MDESQSFKHSLMDTNLVRQSMIEYHMAVCRIVHNTSICKYLIPRCLVIFCQVDLVHGHVYVLSCVLL